MSGITWHLVTIEPGTDNADVAKCRCGWPSGDQQISDAAMKAAIASHLRASREYGGLSQVLITHHRQGDIAVVLAG